MPVLNNIQINGPFWTASAQVVKLSKPDEHEAWRTLFLNHQMRSGTEGNQIFLPGTIFALCFIRQVRIILGTSSQDIYQWDRPNSAVLPNPSHAQEIDELIATRTLSLLLLHADSQGWSLPDVLPPPFSCLLGDISLEGLAPQEHNNEDDKTRLYEALNLIPTLSTNNGPVFPYLSVHASGLSLYGAVQLPWETNPLNAYFQLARIFPDPINSGDPPVPSFLLSIEEELLSDFEKRAFIEGWRQLGVYLTPLNPNFSDSAIAGSAPEWATLEITNPFHLPRLSWGIEPSLSSAEYPLYIDPAELSLVLSSQQLYKKQGPPTSIARVPIDNFVIHRQADSSLKIMVHAALPEESDLNTDSIHYFAKFEELQNVWQESWSLSQMTLAYNPIQVAQQLRQDQGLPSPEWIVDNDNQLPLEQPLLWGFVPLEDGWAQLPLLNVTESIYLDAQLFQGEIGRSDPLSLLQGVLVLGNDTPSAQKQYPEEQPWRLTVLRAVAADGVWELKPDKLGYCLSSVTLTLSSPETQIDGLIWLSSCKASTKDALPDLAARSGGLRPVSLRTSSSDRDLFPSPMVFRLESLSVYKRQTTNAQDAAPKLGPYTFSYGFNTDFVTLLEEKFVIPAQSLYEFAPLIWRRHPTLPMIQALPLTQNQSPPNHPNSSRQFAPFNPGPGARWQLGVMEGNGASQWPHWLGATVPDKEWQTLFDLPLVSLSIPGLILDPMLDPEVDGLGINDGIHLPMQYRYDLPYTDEVNALAQLPKETGNPDDLSPPTISTFSAVALALKRELFSDHWRQLSELASLAAVDAVEAAIRQNNSLFLAHLVEPFRWPVEAIVEESTYPGKLTFADASGESNPVVELEGDQALTGISGRFGLSPDRSIQLLSEDMNNNPFIIQAGGMDLHIQGESIRDQRGLSRAASRFSHHLISTEVVLENEDASSTYLLTTSRGAISLLAANAEWVFWFRDVPLQGGVFTSQMARSRFAEDINDPESRSRNYNLLKGFEWRLAEAGNIGAASPCLRLCNLDFYPLALERLSVIDGVVKQVALLGRLQLPVNEQQELVGLNNTVCLTFQMNENQELRIIEASLESEVGEWPLEIYQGEQTDAARIEWGALDLTWSDASDSIPYLRLKNVAIRFYMFDIAWSVPLDDLVFSDENPSLSQKQVFNSANGTPPVAPRELMLVLDCVTGLHTALLSLDLHIGTVHKPLLTAVIDLPIAGGTSERISSALLFGQLDLNFGNNLDLQLLEGSVQLTWEAIDPGMAAISHIFPGMPLGIQDCPGAAVLSFTAVAQPDTLPRLELNAGFAETVLQSQWGEYLQAAIDKAATNNNTSPLIPLDPLFSSSAGDMTFAYNMNWVKDSGSDFSWEETLLLNGFIEVHNLISWPTEIVFDDDEGTLTLPAISSVDQLSHLRHGLRILFNQHEIPSSLFVYGNTVESSDLLFHLASGMTWQFLAVTEHYLMKVTPDDRFQIFTVSHQNFWSTLQEVRVFHPSSFKEFLLKNEAFTPDPAQTLIPLSQSEGYFHQTWVETLTDSTGSESLERLPGNGLLIDASVPSWLRVSAAESAFTTLSWPSTTLQYLPTGTQRAILSNPADYLTVEPGIRDWLLLTLPFLGRLQNAENDGLETSRPANLTSLQMDPVLRIARSLANSQSAYSPLTLMLSNWGEKAAMVINVSPMDTAVGRTWARLDNTSLAENWFRLQNPPNRPEMARMQSIVMAHPDTPAQLSQANALRRSFQTLRTNYPPRGNPDLELPPFILDGEIVWRPDNILEWQSASAPRVDYPWHITGLQIISSGLIGNSSLSTNRHAAATILPNTDNVEQGTWPLALTISPYLGISFSRSSTKGSLRIAAAELVGIQAFSHQLSPVAGQLKNLTDPETGDIEYFKNWGREVRQRIIPNSPIGLLRIRGIQAAGSEKPGTDTDLTTSYRFVNLPVTLPIKTLSKRVFRLRSSIPTLHYREGQYGGTEIPGEALLGFELAPPQINGLQSLHLIKRPAQGDPDTQNTLSSSWPWGFSGLRVSVQYTENQEGIIGELPFANNDNGDSPITIWWQTPNHSIQYRSSLSTSKPAAGLPRYFRAPAMKNLLPVLPKQAVPPNLKNELYTSSEGSWQPILPGAVRYLLSGGRPGAMMALRHQLQRQSYVETGESQPSVSEAYSVSGSIPVQHRMPRPVPIPKNEMERPEKALQPWASAFDPETNLMLTPAPADEAFFASSGYSLTHKGLETLAQTGVPETLLLKIRAMTHVNFQTRAAFLDRISTFLAEDELAEYGEQIVEQSRPEPHRLKLQISRPLRGAVQAGWTGQVDFFIIIDNIVVTADLIASLNGKLQDWELTIELADDQQNSIPYIPQIGQPVTELLAKIPALTYLPQTGSTSLSRWLSSKPAGSSMFLKARVRHKSLTPGFAQTLTLPIRLDHDNGVHLPLELACIHFEDPDYNRRLTTQAGKADLIINETISTSGNSEETQSHTVTLYTDRREYNARDEVFLRYDWDDERALGSADLELKRLEANGITSPLIPPDTIQLHGIKPGQLLCIPLAQLLRGAAQGKTGFPLSSKKQAARESNLVSSPGSLSLQPGDGLIISLRVNLSQANTAEEIKLIVNIVQEATTPTPKAAYALLRWQEGAEGFQVSCERFAWGPSATRIDLVCAEDLKTELVRRRAVFQWQDVYRTNTLMMYAIQKIAQTGSIHFPEPVVFNRAYGTMAYGYGHFGGRIHKVFIDEEQ